MTSATASRSGKWLVPLIYAASLFAFVSDLYRDNMLAYGLIYTPLVSTAVFFRRRRMVWVLCGIAIAMVIIGAFFPVIDADIPDLVANRILSMLTIIATAIFLQHARNIQERLAAETRRAEAAERIKSELLTNLSNEMRTPLHGLLGVLQLMMTNCRPDQREVLSRVRGGAHALLGSLDNLVDLTQLDERQLRPKAIDLLAQAADAVERARFAANERQVSVMLEPRASALHVLADEWAIRRILDNLLASAIQGTGAGGTVRLTLDRDEGMATISVSDPRLGGQTDLAYALTPQTEADADSFSLIVGTGLTLSFRLARSIGGRLSALDHPQAGRVLVLSLPAGLAQSG